MNKKPFILGSLLGLLPLAAAGQPLDLKTGAWEMTHKSTTLPRPMVEKECLTKADMAQLAGGPDKDDDAECKTVKPPTVSGKTWSVLGPGPSSADFKNNATCA